MNTQTQQPAAMHTPTPWYAAAPYSQEIRTHKPINKYDDIVATVYGGADDDSGAIRKANAAFIVRAANNYVALVAALEDSLKVMEGELERLERNVDRSEGTAFERSAIKQRDSMLLRITTNRAALAATRS